MEKLTDRKTISHLILLCASAYFISYLTRINYAAVVSAFVAESGTTQAQAALPATGLFITYGIGQLLSGYLGDRIPPRHLISAGFILTAVMNFIMPLAPNITVMILVWCINGFAQAMMWPPLVKIMTCAFDDAVYRRACVLVSYGSSAGTIAVYLLAPACVSFSGWRSVFYFAGICAVAMLAVWNIAMNRFEKAGMPTPVVSRADQQSQTQDTAKSGTSAVLQTMGIYLLFIMLAIILQGMIRDGVTTWMPSFIKNTYHLGDSISILTGVVLPIFAIFSFELTSWLNRKLLPNELACAGVVAGISFLAAALLYIVMGTHAIPAIFLMAVIVACMHGVNLILICMLPSAFSRFGNVSMVSGLLNFCTYIGSAASTYGMAKISDTFGWHATVLSWAVIALGCAICCFVCVRKWKSFVKR